MSSLFEYLDQRELRSAVIGMVFGDLNLQIHGANARAQTSHTPRVRDYVHLKGTILRQIPGLACSITDTIQKNRKLGKEYPTIKLRTSTNSFLTELEQRIYRPTKHVDAELLGELTPFGLALWYMDDGHLDLHRNVSRFRPDRVRTRQERSIAARNIKLNTQSFSRQENDLICAWLGSRWGLEARTKTEKGQPLVYMNTAAARGFVDIVRPFVLEVPSMRYKIDFRYKRVLPDLARFNIGYWFGGSEQKQA